MFFSSWLRNRTTIPRANRAATLRQRPARFRPALEMLEDRCVPSTLTVTNTLDSGDGSLRADVTAAHKGDTIVFNIPKSDPGYNASTGVWTITLTSGELLIKQNLSITGPGASQLTISGDKLSRVFELSIKTKPQVSLSGMTLSNGDGLSGITEGGAINNYGTLTISNSVLSGNSAFEGGAISNDGTLTVNGCILTGNSTTPGGFGGGAIVSLSSGVVTVSNCTLSDNSAVGGNGGGISTDPDSTLNLSGCTLYGNSAARGGAIFAGYYSTVDLNGCTLTDNSATQFGGAIFIGDGCTATVSGSVVGPATVNNTLLPGNSAAFGGGIFVDGGGGTLHVTNSSTITGNTAPAGQGADVLNNRGTVSVDASSIIGILEQGML
jgi:hypothetical protein